jgi:hypothetical protein
MKPIPFNKNTVLSVILLATCALIINRIIPVSVDPVLKLVISKNRISINDINQTRDIESSKEIMVDVLDIAEQNRFKHAKLGELGYAGDFFVDLNTTFTVKQAGNYHFIVASDDGFKLTIDDKLLCHFSGVRGLSTQNCSTTLSEGEHRLQLNYFQGYANAGLKVQYTKVNSNKTYWVGENSASLRFD